MSPYQGLEEYIRMMDSSENESSKISSLSSLGSSDINSTKTSDFLDFSDTKSKSNSCKITIHLLNFPPMIR
jgi:hypothetical protein